MTIYFDAAAKESIGQYYENYQNVYHKTSSGKRYTQSDITQRAYHYTQIKNTVLNNRNYMRPTHIKDGINHIDIPNIADIGYEVFQEKSIIVIRNILFKGNQSTTNNFQQNNQIQYQNVSGTPYFGMTMVKSNNGLFNFTYIKNGKKWFLTKEWYKNAKDFAKYSNGVVAGQVFDGSVLWWVYSDGRPKEQVKNNTITSSITPETIQRKKQKLIETTIRKAIAKMFPPLKINNRLLSYYID